MAINSRAFVEPALVLGGVDADQENVVFVVAQEISDVEMEGRVAAEIVAEIDAVEDDNGVAKNAVEFEKVTAKHPRLGNFEDAAIPPDAGFGEVAANGLVSVIPEFGRVDKRKSDDEIVRQVDGLPLAVVEIWTRRAKQLARLGKCAVLPEAEIPGRIVSVTEVKAPVE